jgi:hypothetical protein
MKGERKLCSTIPVGHRVKLHPATDWWMRGARIGELVKVGPKWLHVHLWATRRVVRLAPADVFDAGPWVWRADDADRN